MNGYTFESLKSFKNTNVVFGYEGQKRSVVVEEVKVCKNGNPIITGRDETRDNSYRSFNINKIEPGTFMRIC